ncbi:hypothetical protein FE391_13660 [Nonomuraea sp. KC401]|uniref:hypothetical protein n=1 Tax=unclassified Nonomuraea TaxID=2593643 RepID=UPI0010FDADB9|nr:MULTISPECIES: hypothetical protein [unclassified Nonomuraea]NBE93423.1 hypothetical protein [Nonomuraea sp. K271]TLF74978.1 hypothetical protein FE391_13660 [Nonomuraea sp. KC401]
MSHPGRSSREYRTSYENLEDSSEGIREEGNYLFHATDHLREEVYRLAEYFGNPSTDEVARVFRNGQDGRPGFDEVYHDLDRAMQDMLMSYTEISATLNSMSATVKEADWITKLNVGAVQRLVEFSARTNDSITVPTTKARHH